MAAKLTDEQRLARIREEEAALLKKIEDKKAEAHQTLTEELKANEAKIAELDKLEEKETGEVKTKFTAKRDKLISRNLEIETILDEAKSDVVSVDA